jgi:hypothetical protein
MPNDEPGCTGNAYAREGFSMMEFFVEAEAAPANF